MALIKKRFAHIDTSAGVDRPGDALDAAKAYITGSLKVGSTESVGAIESQLQTAFGGTIPDPITIISTGNPFIVADDVKAFTGNIDVGPMGDEYFSVKAPATNFNGQISANLDIISKKNILPQGPSNIGLNDQKFNELHVENAYVASDLHAQSVYSSDYVTGSSLTANTDLTVIDGSSFKVDSRGLSVGLVSSLAQLSGSAGAEFSHGDLMVLAGMVSASGDLKTDSNVAAKGTAGFGKKLTVSSGGMEVTGSAALHDNLTVEKELHVEMDKFVVDGSAATLKEINFAVKDMSSTEMFTVDAQTGNTVVTGELHAQQDAFVANASSVVVKGVELLVKNSNGNNQFVVAPDTGNTTINGSLTVSQDLVVLGDRIEAQITQLRIEDGLITLMSGSTSRAMSSNPGNEAGIEVEVGGEGDKPAIEFKSAIDSTGNVNSGSWQANLNWIPEQDSTWDLGVSGHKWRGLLLSGQANVGSLELNKGAITNAGSVAASSLTLSDDLHAANVYSAGALTGSSLNVVNNATIGGTLGAGTSTLASLSVTADATVGGKLGVTDVATFSGAVTASAGISSSNVQATGNLSGSTLTVGSTASFAGLATFNNSATVSSGSTLTIADGAKLNVLGTAQYVNLAATGNGTFSGSLTVGGIDISPIAAATPVSTSNDSYATLLTEALDPQSMAKMELEVIASNITHAAAWKISIAAQRKENGEINAAAVELSKEVLAGDGMKLDVEISDLAGVIVIKAAGAAGVGTVYWDAQIVKKMVISTVDGSRRY
jgi:hypothetical protein